MGTKWSPFGHQECFFKQQKQKNQAQVLGFKVEVVGAGSGNRTRIISLEGLQEYFYNLLKKKKNI
ncbi:hypothetical protein [Psychromonas sp. KJ10-2]|uniref:hypothetical protein n=1 Tax=Psychromonas sp. KJ10-2 TaxID=3391822 RepID=UPI0039B5277D